MSHASVTAENESPAFQPDATPPEAPVHAGGAETATSCRQCRRPRAKKRAAFQPSKRQQQLAEILATDRDALTITSLCEKAGVTRNTFYRWQRDTQFQLWLARIAMQTLLATSPLLLMQGVNDALNGDVRAWRIMLNFAYNPRGLAGLDAFLARLEENAANNVPADRDDPPSALGDDSAEAAKVETSQNTTMPSAGIGSTIATTARVVRDLRRSGAKCHTPAPPKPKFEVSYKYTPPTSKSPVPAPASSDPAERHQPAPPPPAAPVDVPSSVASAPVKQPRAASRCAVASLAPRTLDRARS